MGKPPLMPFPTAARDYLLKALGATPVLLSAVARDLRPSELDRRPDPERFTIREVLAHLADWEPVWLERVQRIATGERPFLPSVDESALAIENSYEESDPHESLSRFEVGRAGLVAFLGSVGDEAWDYVGDREFVGALTLQQQATFALSHDCYHLRQIVEWRR